MTDQALVLMQDTPIKSTDTLVVECYIRAKPSDVFSDLTVPDRLLRWWGDPSKWRLTSAEVDLRPGGRFWVMWENTKGESDGMGGNFKAINPNGFVLSFVGSHAKNHIDEVTIRLDPENGGTRVVLNHSGLAGRPEQCTANAVSRPGAAVRRVAAARERGWINAAANDRHLRQSHGLPAGGPTDEHG
jgi:uncharacterized protein YndB with AHSA1/START domain